MPLQWIESSHNHTKDEHTNLVNLEFENNLFSFYLKSNSCVLNKDILKNIKRLHESEKLSFYVQKGCLLTIL